tara:strand:+ start:1327 stop:2238 length:912 start_codon:yes stop_codon:yes gene_type:complete
MNLISKINQIKKKISGQILFNENLSKYSWFNIGGSATVVFKPKNLNELSLFLKNLNKFSQIKVLGLGSNTLIRDGGYNGIIIKLGKSFSRISMFKENMIVAGSSALDKQVSNFAYENSLSGFEFLSCIPGTIGGGIRMNSGCYGKDLSKILVSLQVMDFNGNMRVIYSSDIKFSYRKCSLSDDLIFISATFEGKKLDNKNIKSKITNLTERKKKDQPYGVKTCGSTFKNPPKKKAWALIKESGCAGINIGDAYISEKHCNFFVNKGKATSQELENLINEVRKKVLNKTGVKLELELEILGEKS